MQRKQRIKKCKRTNITQKMQINQNLQRMNVVRKEQNAKIAKISSNVKKAEKMQKFKMPQN